MLFSNGCITFTEEVKSYDDLDTYQLRLCLFYGKTDPDINS